MSSSNSNDIRMQLRDLGRRCYQDSRAYAESTTTPHPPQLGPLLPNSQFVSVPPANSVGPIDPVHVSSIPKGPSDTSEPIQCDEEEPDLDSLISISTCVIPVASPTASISTKHPSRDDMTSPLMKQEKMDTSSEPCISIPVVRNSSSTSTSAFSRVPLNGASPLVPTLSTGLSNSTESGCVISGTCCSPGRPHNSPALALPSASASASAFASNNSALSRKSLEMNGSSSSRGNLHSAQHSAPPDMSASVSASASASANGTAHLAEEAEWLTCACPDSACGCRLFFQQSDRVVSCSGCFRSHPLYQLLARARRTNGPEAAEDDRQAFAHWSAALATSRTRDAADGDECSVGTCSSEDMVTRLRKQTARLGSRDLQCVMVRGLCGFHCKLLSPLLTYYGIDRSDGDKPVPLAQIYKKRRAQVVRKRRA